MNASVSTPLGVALEEIPSSSRAAEEVASLRDPSALYEQKPSFS